MFLGRQQCLSLKKIVSSCWKGNVRGYSYKLLSIGILVVYIAQCSHFCDARINKKKSLLCFSSKTWWIITEDGIKKRFFSIHSVVLEPVFLPSQATIFTLSTLISSVTSLNSTSFNTKVHTLSQNLYVFREPLKLTLFLTLCANAEFIALSNWSRTWRASWGVICWDCMSSSRLSWRLFPKVVFLYNWYAMA